MGCATKHEEDDGVLKVTRMCIENSAICAYSQAADFYVDCCKGELCNHVNSSITPRPATFSPTTDVDQTVPTSSVPPSDETGGETPHPNYIATIPSFLLSLSLLGVCGTWFVVHVAIYSSLLSNHYLVTCWNTLANYNY